MKTSTKAGVAGAGGAFVLALSLVGADHLQRLEGIELTAYPDPATKGEPWTICTGLTGNIHYDGKVVRVARGLKLTHEQCRQADAYVAEQYRAAMNKCITRPLNQNQSDAVIIFSINVGPSNACSSSAIKKINAGDFQGAAKALEAWSCAPTRDPKYPIAHCGPNKRQMPGLLARRKFEGKLLTSPVILRDTAGNMAVANKYILSDVK